MEGKALGEKGVWRGGSLEIRGEERKGFRENGVSKGGFEEGKE